MAEKQPKRRTRIRTWVRRAFVCWAIFCTLYLGNSMRTKGVAATLLVSDDVVHVESTNESLEFRPSGQPLDFGLIFICGSGVAAEAYAPMLRPIAEAGYEVHVIRLPWRFGPLESHKQTAVDRAMAIVRGSAETRWIVAGHSLGGALTARIARDHASEIDGVVLIGTTHPKADDLSNLTLPVTKVFGDADGVAPSAKVRANRDLLPKSTNFIELRGANHSQFGHYGHQLMDGTATMSRDEQQQRTRDAILEMLKSAK